ncbi:hypothetical protein [Vibrio astriarenae]|uniref:hypothetical protein n=1 Tax=Vibrio astriarenae TaxID=1481923 RepID=UPI0037363C25
MQQLKKDLLPAFIQALILCIVRVFTIPYQIWSGAVTRLAEQRKLPMQEQKDTEFPVLYWFKSAWDGAIVLSWVVAVLMFVFAVFAAFNTYNPSFVITAAFGQLLIAYFYPIGLSITKELLTLFLSMALNLEKLAKGDNQNKSKVAQAIDESDVTIDTEPQTQS